MTSWDELLSQFGYHGEDVDNLLPYGRPSADPLAELRRIVAVWAPEIEISPETITLKSEKWGWADLLALLDRMEEAWRKADGEDTYLTAKPPRLLWPPVVVLRYEGGTYLLDGRRRINLMRGRSPLHSFDVIVVEPRQ